MDEDPRAGQDHHQKPPPRPAAADPADSGAADAAGGPLAPSGPRRYALGRINVIVLGSARETPKPRLLSTEFSFPQCSVGSVVIHTCLSGNDRQSAHGWLFQSAEPDLFRERPIAELAINSTGDAAVSPGCPPDYDALALRVFPPAVTVRPAPRDHSRKAVLIVGLAAALVVPSTALIVLADRIPAPGHAGEHSLAATPWITKTTVELPLPIVLPTPPKPDPELAQLAPVRQASAPRPPPARHRKTVKKPRRDAPAAPIAQVAEAAAGVAGTSTVEAAVSENARVLVAERPQAVESGAGRLAREQAACANAGWVRGAFCREAARWSHCHPDKWDKAPECMVQTDALEP
jgi:hypothetical protein